MTRHPLARTRRLFLEMAVVLVPPLAWFVDLQLGYALVPWSCNTGHRVPLHLAALVTVAITAAMGMLAWRSRPRERRTESRPVVARSRFLTFLGVTSSALFVLVLLTNELARLVIDPCISSAG
jgi:hypothetical protein